MVPDGMRATPDCVLDGHKVARHIRDACLPLIEERVKAGRRPHLAVVRVGAHPAALVHAEAWRKEATVWGIEVQAVQSSPSEQLDRDIVAKFRGSRKSDITVVTDAFWLQCTA